MRRTAALLVAAGVVCIAGVAEAGAATRVRPTPSLHPKFSPRIFDYVSRCPSGRRLRISLRGPRSTRVTIDHRRPRKGRQRARLRLRGGQGVTVKVATRRRRAAYHVRCLPKHFVDWTAHRHGKTQARFYIVTPAEGNPGSKFVVIFDNHGVPV